MKNFLLIFISLFIGFHNCNAQFFEWTKEYRYWCPSLDTTGARFFNGTEKEFFSIQGADKDILLLIHHKTWDYRNISYATYSIPDYSPPGYKYDSLLLIKVAQDGSIAWQKDFPFNGHGMITAVTAMPDSGYLLCGYQSGNLMLIRLDKNGNPIFIKEWPRPVQKIKPVAVTTIDGYYYMLTAEIYFASAEHDNPGHCYFDRYYNLSKIDASGNLQWTRNTGHDHFFYSYPMDIDTSITPGIQSSALLQKTPGQSMIDVVTLESDSLNLHTAIQLRRYDNSGNLLKNKTLLDSVFSNPLLDDHPLDEINGLYSSPLTYYIRPLHDGYIFLYNSAIYTDYSDSLGYVATSYSYYQKFDLNGNNKGKLSRYNIYPLNTAPDIDFAKIPSSTMIDDNAGNLYSISNSNIWTGDPYNFGTGYLTLNQYDPFLQLTHQTKSEELSYFMGADQYISELYSAADSGFLAVSFYETPLSAFPGYGIHVTKFGSHRNSIHYQCYIDRNNNGYEDTADMVFVNGLIQLEHQQTTKETYMNFDGQGVFYADTGTYISRLISYHGALKHYDIYPAEQTMHFSNLGNNDSITFRLVPKPGFVDLKISISPLYQAMPAKTTQYNGLIENYGNDTARNVQIKFLKDPKQELALTDLFPITFSGDTMIYDVGTLYPYQTFPFFITEVNDTPYTHLGDTLYLQAFAWPVSGDLNAEDNSAFIYQPVEPLIQTNDKVESHGSGITTSQLSAGEYLYYTIRFQNKTGNYCNYISVTDTLSDLLDWNSFEMLGCTDMTYRLSIKDKHIVTWNLDNIYLTDTNSYYEATGHGFISFRIRPKSGLMVNDVIENRATIYLKDIGTFETNTCITKILQERVTTVKNNPVSKINLYPNPATDRLTLEFNMNQSQLLYLRFYDISGKLLQQQKTNCTSGSNVLELSTGDYSNGIYFITLSTESEVLYYGKILKE